MKMTRNQSGFTLIELMIATVIFSVVLLVILASFMQIGRMYYKGISLANTQNAARTLTDSITNDLRFTALGANYTFQTSDLKKYLTDKQYFCIGNHRYTYTLFNKVTAADFQDENSLNGVQVATFDGTPGTCPAPDDTTATITAKDQLLTPNMQLNKFDYQCANGRCNISLHILYYGANDQVFTSSENPNYPSGALKDPDAQCTGSLYDSQFCGVVDLNTTVLVKE